MFCGMCGEPMGSDEKFCKSCGWRKETNETPNSDENVKPSQSAIILENTSNFNNSFFNDSVASKEKPPRKTPAWYVTLGAVVLTFVMITFFCAICTNMVISKLTSREKIKDILSENDFTSEIIWNADFAGDNTTLGDFLVDEIAGSVGEKQAKEIVEVLEVDEYIGDMFSDIMAGALSSEGIPEMDAEKLIENFEEHKEEIEDITGEKYTKADIADTKESIREFTKDFNNEVAQINQDYFESNTLKLVDDGTKFVSIFYWVILIVCVTLIFLMYFFTKTGIYRGFRCITVASGVSFGIVFGLSKLIGIIFDQIELDSRSMDDLVSKLLNELASIFTGSSLFVGVIFVVCLVATIVLHIVYNSRTQNY